MKHINRRDFLKISGTAAAAVALASCKNNANSELGDVDPMGHHTDPVPTGKMTYRTNPNNNDRVSLLGYGWMRLPMLPVEPSMAICRFFIVIFYVFARKSTKNKRHSRRQYL